MYQDLSKRHDWPLKKPLFDWPIRLKGNSLSSLKVQNQWRNQTIQRGVAGTLASNIDAFYFTENSLKIKRKYHRKKGGPTAKSGKENKDLGAASQLLVSGHGSYIIFWEKIKEFSRTKILFSRLLFPNNIKQRPLECVDGGGFAYCNTCLH